MVTVPSLVTVHTAGVDAVYVSASPELAEPVSAKVAASSSTGAGAANVIVCPVRTKNDCGTDDAAAYVIPPVAPPAWLALMVHVPGPMMVTVPPLVTLQMPADAVLKVTVRPAEDVAETAKLPAVGFLSANAPKVMVCDPFDKKDRVTVGAAA
jgi:hypothetical protein